MLIYCGIIADLLWYYWWFTVVLLLIYCGIIADLLWYYLGDKRTLFGLFRHVYRGFTVGNGVFLATR